MKSIRKTCVISLLAFILLISTVSADEVITLGSDPWPPYITGNLGSDADGGTAVEVFNKIFERVDGVSVSLPLLPWNRALKGVREGTLDGIQLLRKTSERETYMLFSDSIFISRELIWYSDKRFPKGFDWATKDDLKPYVVGVVSGYSYSEEFDKILENNLLTVTKVSNADKIFSMLEAGHIDIGLASESVGLSLAREHNKVNITAAKKAIAEEPHYISFSKKSKVSEFIPAINQAIQSLKQEGEIERIMFQR
jgi:polar amino acid transport system substrate-binding protein